jgi:deoxyribonuclease-1-like protein
MKHIILAIVFLQLSLFAGELKIASFNIQTFGKSKRSKPEVMEALVQIIRKYDLVAIQEIKDASGKTPQAFLDAINATDGPKYTFLASQRTGLQEDDRTKKEQYAFYYNTETLRALDEGYLYNDEENDDFNREPFIARFKAPIQGGFSFAIGSIHTTPDVAKTEIPALHKVFVDMKAHYSAVKEDDFMIVGDYNADGSYYDEDKKSEQKIGDEDLYKWVTPDDADTNFSVNTAQAYDRIVITKNTDEEYLDKQGVDTEAVPNKKISDHFPIWAVFSDLEAVVGE